MRRKKSKGRKRDLTAERYPSGGVRHKGVDRGTVETQARRVALVNDGDQTKASYPLGILFANGVISESQLSAACRLAWLYGVTFGRISLAAVDYERGIARAQEGEDSPKQAAWREECQGELSRLLTAIERHGRRSREEVVAVAIFETLPRWALPCIPSMTDLRMAQEFMKGIEALEMAIVSPNATLTA